MKVFTVGLEQKPPMEDTKSTKSDSPPPGYSTTEARIPLPLGPELPRAPMPPTPILVRKSRGYKGILLVMLSVFLMAVFALVLSEMAYNRQRDENFFKLRWAELKHRMGYEDGPFEYYQRAAASIGDKFDRMLNLAKSELPSAPIAQSLQVEEESTSTSTSPPPTPEPIVAIDSFPMAPGSGSSSAGSSSRSSQASFEIEPPQPIFGGAGLNALNQFRDARLQFLRNILQKIKQHAEDIGFDGTMQVSIIEVEPQNGAAANGDTEENGNGPVGMGGAGWPPQRQLILPQQQQFVPPQMPPQIPPLHFFPHPRPLIEDFKNSRSFLDGFGEFHQPQQQFMHNNQVNEPEERPRMFGPWAPQPNDFPPPPPPPMMQQQNLMEKPEFMENMPRWGPRFNPFRPPIPQQQQQPEVLFFHPIFPQQMSLRFPPIMPQQQQQQGPPEWAQPPQQQQGPLPRPAAFDRWSGQPQPQGMAEQQQQQQQLQPAQQPQQQQPLQPQPAAVQPQTGGQQQPQIQIDFPEVKPPVVADSSAEDKFPVAPPHPQPKKPDWLPKWLFESPGVVNNNAGGPPAQQPAEMVKFPSVTVLEPASQVDGQKMVADNENRGETGSDQGQQDGDTAKVVDSAKGETGPIGQQPDDVIEVDAAPQQSEQQQNQQQQPSAQQAQDGQREQQPEQPAAQQQQQPAEQPTIQMQKWFPEVPSVFFQVDDPNEAAAQPAQTGQQQQQSEQQPQQQGATEH